MVDAIPRFHEHSPFFIVPLFYTLHRPQTVSASSSHKPIAGLLAALIFLGAANSPAPAPNDEKRISVYSAVATYTLPVVDRNGHEYIGLLEMLEPLGRVSARADGRHWKLQFNSIDSDFVAGKTRAKIRGRDWDLPGPFLIESSRGLVPVNSLSTLLPRFLGSPVNFHESARRLFLGDVAVQVTTRLDSANPSRLVLDFSAPVNPTIATEPGKLRMVFVRDPLMPPGNQPLSFNDQTITQANYAESNGAAELTISATVPLLATFTNGGRTITVGPTPQETTGGTPAAGVAPGGTPGTSATLPPASPRFIAIVDPAHGGDELGSSLSDTVLEKNVDLGFGRLLRHELETRGISTILLRDNDSRIPLNQRADAANGVHVGVYLSLHASSQGTGVRIFTSLLPLAGETKGVFRPWNVAQAPALGASQTLAATILSELQKHQFPAQGSRASVGPLNHVLLPAIAIELAPPKGNAIEQLASANYQQRIASVIADAVAAQRDRPGAQP